MTDRPPADAPRTDSPVGDALTEPTRPRTTRYRSSPASRFGLVVFALGMVIVFSILLPNTFLSVLNLRSIVSANAVVALLALASVLPIAAGKFDISLGYGVGLAELLAVYFQVRTGLPWTLTILILLLLGLVIGLVNGVLVAFVQIDSFIATLGTGSVLYGLMLWVSDGNQILGTLSPTFLGLYRGDWLGVPNGVLYVVVVAVVLWVALEFLPMGRYLYASGANPRAAELNGVPVKGYIIAAYVGSGVLTAMAGVLLASQLGSGEPSIGDSYLLPALVGALLGTTTIRPGRANAWGTIVAVATLAIGISGLEQWGAQFFVSPLFNGFTLLVSVGIAGVATRRRVGRNRQAPAVSA
jgi:ribose transport system permease protein